MFTFDSLIIKNSSKVPLIHKVIITNIAHSYPSAIPFHYLVHIFRKTFQHNSNVNNTSLSGWNCSKKTIYNKSKIHYASMFLISFLSSVINNWSLVWSLIFIIILCIYKYINKHSTLHNTLVQQSRLCLNLTQFHLQHFP